MLNALCFGLGCAVPGAAAIVPVVPIVMPLVRELGIDPVHFGIVVTLTIAIGQQTPPVAALMGEWKGAAIRDLSRVRRKQKDSRIEREQADDA